MAGNEIYFDNSATTPLCDAAREKMLEAMALSGNPSSVHAAGVAARKMLEEARSAVGFSLGLRTLAPGQLLFTSCGTEADHLALMGCAHAKERRTANRIVTTDSEHPAVENTLKLLEKDGFEVVRIGTRGGILDEEQLEAALDERVFLVTMMLVNNETGARYEVEKVFARAKQIRPEVLTHCDAVQGYLRVPFTPASLGADLVSISAHKIHGPKGVGALYVHPEVLKTKRIVPMLPGGGQEFGYRSGTENLIGIAGFGAAAAEGLAHRDENIARMVALRDRIESELETMHLQVNRPAGQRAPHVISMTLPSIKSETMLNFLSGCGICVSSGSACSSHSHGPSSTLLAFGLTVPQADSTIRISLSGRNTEEDAEALCAALRRGVMTLVRRRR